MIPLLHRFVSLSENVNWIILQRVLDSNDFFHVSWSKLYYLIYWNYIYIYIYPHIYIYIFIYICRKIR